MSANARVTVTLPQELLLEIDRNERNRSKFILEAVQREIQRRRREALERSLANPHTDSQQVESIGLREWFEVGGEEEVETLLDPACAKNVQWLPGQGWVKRSS